MYINGKAVSDDVPLGQIVFYQSFFAIIPLVLFLWIRNEVENTLHTLWRVVLADGMELEVENEVLHRVEVLLGVSTDRAKELHDEVVEERLAKDLTVQMV